MNTDADLMAHIKRDWKEAITRVCAASAIAPAFLAALVANESSGWRAVTRFEPRIWKHLHDVAGGEIKAYGSVDAPEIAREGADIAKTAEYHRAQLTEHWAGAHASLIADGGDALIRQLATSFGLTQIMGYHTLGWNEVTPLDLLNGHTNLRCAVRLLSTFVAAFHLELPRQHAQLFRTWNTGSPDPSHPTFDPSYIENGLKRMALYGT